ncbi:MAG: LLM class flavin-dependent oxidoreductase [Proteobacteria bacterium]|nr:LLM class flavin-dependent oxidoreductase [Pseudomonadota bacterium]
MVERTPPTAMPAGDDLTGMIRSFVQRVEDLNISHLLIAQRWWGNGEEIEGSSLDCLAMTAWFAALTSKVKLITAVHPGFFQPSAIAKWGATIDRLTNGRWGINVTSGWNLAEFEMYGIDALSHDERYQRSAEFIEVMRAAWAGKSSYRGAFYQTSDLDMEPRPTAALEIFQGGQSDSAIAMAAEHSDWMFLNGGPPEKIEGIINKVRSAANARGRTVRFALYAAPVCRATTDAAWDEINAKLSQVDADLVRKRRLRVDGAQGMWADTNDPLSALDTNEGYASRLIGSPQEIVRRAREFQQMGVDMLHLDIRDKLFVAEALPAIQAF